jgi:hypothetical protein
VKEVADPSPSNGSKRGRPIPCRNPAVYDQWAAHHVRIAAKSPLALTLAVGGTYLSLLRWYYWFPSMAKAAWNLSLFGLGYSYLVVVAAIYLAVFEVFQRSGWRHTIAHPKRTLCNLLKAAIGPLSILLLSFVGYFYKVYEVVIVHPPQTNITWRPQ